MAIFSPRRSADEAEREFREQNPGVGDTRLIRFKSGRRTQMIRRNVIGIGNAYGFIEALQSTALHMVITNIYAAVLHLQHLKRGRNLADKVNQSVGEIWARLRWFIAMQFRLNRRVQIPFWRACNDGVNVA
ncbi:MAG: tryptophan 7-halogenase [Candidatus Synoicihabitans palmerolidicus]|nr:tryptophan 7-halogenase [Candidatus Synoicihabitans palmerolidicus]